MPDSGPYDDGAVPRKMGARRHVSAQTTGLVRFTLRKLSARTRSACWFTAGGHLVADVSTHWKRVYQAIDEADKESCRPDLPAIADYMLEKTTRNSR